MLAAVLMSVLNQLTMRRTQRIYTTITAALVIALLVFGLSFFVAADTANVPSLTISQLKITSSSGQFITLYNSTSETVDMSKYQLEYFNSYDLAKATSSKLIALSGTVPPHGYYMINDSTLLLCYQVTVDSVSMGLSSTAGFIELLAFNQTAAGQPVTPVLQDYVGWSKTAAAGAQALPSNQAAFLQRQTDGQAGSSISTPGAGSWAAVQPDPANPCRLVSSVQPSAPVQTGGNLLPPAEPSAAILSVPQTVSATAAIPAADIGLSAPQVTEILPNPNGTGNDSTDEFVELYNGNDKNFDLSGFMLQTGLTTFRKYVFPAGTGLSPRSFKVFKSSETGLSLSNSGSQLQLLDPLGASISATEIYGTAKDGVAWALAKGKWYWTAQPTPGSANVIKQPEAAKKKSASSSKKTVTARKGAASATSAAFSGSEDQPALVPIHWRTLAVIIVMAILYGAYEYRADIRNKLSLFKRDRAAGSPNRSTPKGRRGD